MMALAPEEFDEVEAALHTLIKHFTSRRDWFMVERLQNDVGRLMEEQEAGDKV